MSLHSLNHSGKRFRMMMVFTGMVALWGCSSFPRMEMQPGYDMAARRLVGLYVIPSGNESLDKPYTHMLTLELLSRGYRVTDLNLALREHGDTIATTAYIAIVDSLVARRFLPPQQLLVIAHPVWDSTMLVTAIREVQAYRSSGVIMYGTHIPLLSHDLAVYDVAARSTVLGVSDADTCRVYSLEGNRTPSFSDRMWMIAARLAAKSLHQIPICRVEDTSPASLQFPVVLYADKSFRDQFPADWKRRVGLRMVYMNDILRSHFDMELVVKDIREWNTSFDRSLIVTLANLRKAQPGSDGAFHIGLTVDASLKRLVRNRNLLGLAVPLDDDAVMTGQPSFPGMTRWSSFEETLTLIHEIAHLFGALHTCDENSIMYPATGSMSFRFDTVNKTLIDMMKGDFFTGTRTDRLTRYLHLLEKYSKTSESNSHLFASQAAGILLSELPTRSTSPFDSTGLWKTVAAFIADSTMRCTTVGIMEYRLGNHSRAARYLSAAIALDTANAEAHWFLGSVLNKLRRSAEGNSHRDIAKQYPLAELLEYTSD